MTNGRIIAMWSAPRNISTAMMRSWENRRDTVVMDEPYYANFLKVTGIDHPMAQEIMESRDTDWQNVTNALRQVPDSGIFYQKHICTHNLPHIDLEWVNTISNVFLIRDPHLVVASYAAKREDCQPSDLGYDLQKKLFDQVKDSGVQHPLVIDSALFLENPRQQFIILCEQLGIEFDEAMLSWPAGARDTDGIWGAHWYNAVVKSTGFKKQNTVYPDLNEAQRRVAEQCMADYETIKAYAIRH